MKRLLFFSLVLVCGVSYAQNTLPVIPFGDRKADLYYWDTNWYDHYEHMHPNESFYPGMLNVDRTYSFSHENRFLGRSCITDTPIMVKGIAGAMIIRKRQVELYPTLDTSLSGRVTEWFKMYDVNYNLLAEVSLDSVSPTYRMDFRNRYTRDTFNVYEVMFDKPVLVNGKFFVGGTSHNNNLIITGEGVLGYEHIQTYYPHLSFNHLNSDTNMYEQLPNPTEVLKKYCSPYQIYNYQTPSLNYIYYDTSMFFLYDDFYYFLPFFAIIDTDFVYMECHQPAGLSVVGADVDSVVVSWDSSGALQWNVRVWPDGIEPDSGMLFSVQTNRLTLYGLDIDCTYNIKVMAECDAYGINTSDWSDVFRMRICDYIDCPVPEGLIVEPLASDGKAIVLWSHSDVDSYELAIWNDSENEDNATMIISYMEYVVLDGLDTGQWYSAKVRSVCECGKGGWSDTVRFYVPNLNPDGGTTTSIEDVNGGDTYLLPNPTSGKVTVCTSSSLQRIELFGSEGKRIASFEASGFSKTVDLSTYPADTYIVRITTLGGTTTKRIVKK